MNALVNGTYQRNVRKHVACTTTARLLDRFNIHAEFATHGLKPDKAKQVFKPDVEQRFMEYLADHNMKVQIREAIPKEYERRLRLTQRGAGIGTAARVSGFFDIGADLIFIKKSSPESELYTLIHELGHVFGMRFVGSKEGYALEEIRAEATAAIVRHVLLGEHILTNESWEYILSYVSHLDGVPIPSRDLWGQDVAYRVDAILGDFYNSKGV